MGEKQRAIDREREEYWRLWEEEEGGGGSRGKVEGRKKVRYRRRRSRR